MAEWDKYAYIVILDGGLQIGLEQPYIIGTDSRLEEEEETEILQFIVIDEQLEKTVLSIDRDTVLGYYIREVEEDDSSEYL